MGAFPPLIVLPTVLAYCFPMLDSPEILNHRYYAPKYDGIYVLLSGLESRLLIDSIDLANVWLVIRNRELTPITKGYFP